MNNVLITGVAGYIGMKLAVALAPERQVRRIVGIDVAEPGTSVDKLDFIKRDVRESLDDIIKTHDIDTLVHAAFVLPPIHDVALMEDINVNGTRNVMDAAARCGVRHLLYTGSATAYGFHEDNDLPLTEESPLRGNDDFTYSRTKRLIENMIQERFPLRGRMKITVLRPSFVVGPGFTNPLAEYLQKKIVILPSKTHGLQFVHEDDLLAIMLLVLKKGIAGVYNVGGEGMVTFPEMVKMLGGIFVPLHHRVLAPLNALAWKLRLSFITKFPSPALNMALHPWIVSSGKLTAATGFMYRYSSRESFSAYAAFVKKKKMLD